MNIFELTRAFIDIDSVTVNEEAFGNYLFDCLSRIAAATGGRVERMDVARNDAAKVTRFNVLATCWDAPVVTFSTHMDTRCPLSLRRGKTCGLRLGPRRVRYQRDHRVDDLRG